LRLSLELVGEGAIGSRIGPHWMGAQTGAGGRVARGLGAELPPFPVARSILNAARGPTFPFSPFSAANRAQLHLQVALAVGSSQLASCEAHLPLGSAQLSLLLES